jgi:hypothetical protein
MKSLRNLAIGALLIAGTGTLLVAGPDDSDAPDVTAPAMKMGSISAADMTVQADVMVTNMHDMLRHVTQLREKASREKDILKLNCINDKLVPMKGEVNLGDTMRHSLEQAIGSNDESGRYAAYADLTVRRDQADACVGDALTYIGSTDVQVTGPANPLYPPEPGENEVEPPTYRSPFD